VDKSFFGSHRIGEAAIAEALILGCEQGGVTWLPELAVHPLLVPYLSDVLLPRLAAEPTRGRLLAHPAAPGLENAALGRDAPVALAIGPEGGWIASELASFAALGFQLVSAGPSVLRVEAAVAMLVGQLWLWRRIAAS
jgi:RsmE family RNA methyltransferase